MLVSARNKGVGRKIFRGGEDNKKRSKNSEKDREIALLSLFQGEAIGKRRRKVAKKTEK